MSVISVKDVEKKFKVYFDKGQSFKERILFRNRNHYEDRWVLKGISFEVEKAEAIGLIGENGCGKSTLLKLMTKIMYPDKGSIELIGRVSSLIELGAGFHPDMSGRENIYTNAAIFGLTKKEIDNRVRTIIEFSELEEFIDNPVRTYSSGMYMRLAFAVAINVDAEILLIDEILAVGDAAFQAKCFNRLREIKARGTTIVIVSHSMGQIEQICDRAIWLENGIMRESGKPRNVIQKYMGWIMSKGSQETVQVAEAGSIEKPLVDEPFEEEQSPNQTSALETIPEKADAEFDENDIAALRETGVRTFIGNHEIDITHYQISDATTGEKKSSFAVDDSLELLVDYKRNNPGLKDTMFSLAIYRTDGVFCYSTNTYIDTGETINLSDKGSVKLIISPLQLMQGEYSMDISFNKDYGPTYHGILYACSFSVYNTRTDFGVFRPIHRWELDDGTAK